MDYGLLALFTAPPLLATLYAWSSALRTRKLASHYGAGEDARGPNIAVGTQPGATVSIPDNTDADQNKNEPPSGFFTPNPPLEGDSVALKKSELALEMLNAITRSSNSRDLYGSLKFDGNSSSADVALTERERQIIVRLMNGYSNRIIARELHSTEVTIKVQIRGLLRKIRVSNRTQAAVWGLNNIGLVEGDDVEYIRPSRRPNLYIVPEPSDNLLSPRQNAVFPRQSSL